MEVWSCPTIPTLQRPWWWRWISIGGEEERRRKREFCSSVFSALLRYLFYAFFSFFFAIVGTTIGAMTGAVFGMKSERKIGLVHGAAVGAITGATFFLHAVNASFAFWISFHDDEPPSFHLFRPWWWRWISIGGEEERRRKREFCSSVFSALLHYLFYAFFSFFFAVVGTTVGAMTGAVFGMKSERKIGLVHGAAVGAFTGASFFLHVVNASFAFWISFHDNEPPSFHLFIEVITSLLKPTLVYLGEEFGPGMHGPVRNPIEVITSLLKPTLVYLGEEFGPGMHGPVRNPVATVETNNQVPRFLDRKGGNALHRGSILDKLPKTKITDKNIYDSSGNRISCSVCLEVYISPSI
ncbi:hypothetical protein TEA_012576 [Camellia sinensis var. sinensis]|uniref:Uncharacterized protein n=1 Tax=Camellia sinensis var. sinensis TaxID=542762 RepID=A0A4S4EQL5_CAMSN|nr:hypothetical protein TEA_012576 [Camellia sinensis var. sinensis]